MSPAEQLAEATAWAMAIIAGNRRVSPAESGIFKAEPREDGRQGPGAWFDEKTVIVIPHVGHFTKGANHGISES